MNKEKCAPDQFCISASCPSYGIVKKVTGEQPEPEQKKREANNKIYVTFPNQTFDVGVASSRNKNNGEQICYVLESDYTKLQQERDQAIEIIKLFVKFPLRGRSRAAVFLASLEKDKP